MLVGWEIVASTTNEITVIEKVSKNRNRVNSFRPPFLFVSEVNVVRNFNYIFTDVVIVHVFHKKSTIRGSLSKSIVLLSVRFGGVKKSVITLAKNKNSN